MKRFYLFKMLLVVAGMLVGSSVWGAVTWDFTNSTTWGSVALPEASNNYADCSYNANGESATTGNYITFHSSSGKIVHPNTTTNGIGFSSTGSTSDHYVKMSVPAGSTVTVTAYVSSNRNIKVYFNGAESSAFSANWQNVAKDFINDTENALDLYIYCSANAGGASNAPYLRSISLKQTVPVTINYRDKDDQENTLVSSEVVNVEVGTSYTPTYKTTLYVNDTDPYKYTYESGADATTISASTTINILYSKSDRGQYSYTVNAIKNDDKAIIKQLASGTLYEGASVTVPYPAAFNIGGTLYTRGTTNSEYRQTVTPDKDGFVQTFPYVAQSTTDVFYLIEGEDIEGVTRNTTSTNVSIRSSNAAAASIPDGGVEICTLPAGTYTLHLYVHHTANSKTVTTTFGYGETEFTVETTGTNRVAADAKEFTLTETATLICKSVSTYGLLDNLYITGTSAHVSKSISAAGWATYCYPYALDFTGSGLTAYIVTGNSGETLTKEEVTSVPANTGVLLKGTEGNHNINVVASADAVTGNLLQGVTAATVKDAESIYVLMNETNGLGFYKNASAFTVGANTAYINADDITPLAGGAKVRFLGFDGDNATAINSVESKKAENGVMYNLAGQRVGKDYKGIVIVNGKKVMNK